MSYFFLRKFKGLNLAISKKVRTFAAQNDEEPTVLATYSDRGIPTLTDESALIFLERARKVEEEAERRRNEPPSLEALQQELAMNKFILGQDIDNVKSRYDRIRKLESKIKELEQQNGKTEEE